MSSIHFDPLISPALWLATALAAAGMLAWYAWARPAAAARRRWAAALVLTALGMAGVLLILLNPTWLEPIPPPPGKPLLTVVVDRSASMAVEDGSSGQSRFAEAGEAAARFAPRLARRFDLRWQTFAESSRPSSLEELPREKADGRSTDLYGALAAARADDRPQGQAILLLSDGVHNAAGGVAGLRQMLRSARATDVPVYAVTFGADTVLRDLEVGLARSQELSFVGQRVPLAVNVRQRGALADRAEVVLLKDGAEAGRQTVQLAANGTATATFTITEPRSGLHTYSARIEPLPGEATPANNAAPFLLRVVDEPVRVLLLEGKPYWDAKFLVRSLAADPSVEIAAIVRVADSRFVQRSLRLAKGSEVASGAAAGGPGGGNAEAPPRAQRVETTAILSEVESILGDPERLASYQLLVLGRDTELMLSGEMIENLRLWIARDGGSLVCYRGAPTAGSNEALARVLPVRWTPSRESRFRPQLTERGQELDWLTPSLAGDNTFARLPSLASVATPGRPAPLAVVLATAGDDRESAAVAYQPYGTGRVVTIEGAGMWRWAFLPPRFQEHDQVYSALWQSLLRWLVSGVGLIPGQELALRIDQVAYTSGEAVSATLLLRPGAESQGLPDIALVNEAGATVGTFSPVPFGDEPGVYRVSFGALPDGAYRATALRKGADPRTAGSAATAAFEVREFSGEQLEVQARPDVMASIAEESGGAVLAADGLDAIERQFDEHLARSRPERVRRLTAWDRWWVLSAVLIVWSVAWALRRSTGLV